MLTLNLLPKSEKEEIHRETINFFLIDILLKLTILMLIFLGLTASSYFYARALMEPQKDLFSAETALSQRQDIQKTREEIAKANKTIEDAYNLEQGFYLFAPALENLTTLVSDGIYLKNLTMMESGKKIVINGFAKDRETFLAFKKNLEDSKNFSEIFSPISNLLKPWNVDFSIDLTLK